MHKTIYRLWSLKGQREGLITTPLGTLRISEIGDCWTVGFEGVEGQSWAFHCTIYNLLMVIGGLRYYVAGSDGSCEMRRHDEVVQISTLFDDRIQTFEIPLEDYERVIKGLSYARGDIFLL